MAEGLDPMQADRHLYRQVKAMIEQAVQAKSTEGSSSFSRDEVPAGWTIDCNEISAGVYRLSARGPAGQSVTMTGTDPEDLLADCKRAIEIQSAASTGGQR